MISTTKAALALCASSLLFLGCSGGEIESPAGLLVYDGPTPAGSGGTGGTAGKSGGSGNAGTAGSAGKSGAAGNGGQAGASGKAGASGNAGAAGKAGSAGANAGSGGTNGGAAGSAGATAGSAGSTAGSAGSSAGSAGSTAGTAGSAGSSAGSAGSTAGTAGSAGSSAGTAGAGGGTKACTLASECPGSDDECRQRTCSAEGVCGFDFTAEGTPIATQTAGDCKSTVCDGAGTTKTIDKNDDAPAPADECTTIGCVAGAAVPTSTPPGTKCGTGLLLVCDGNGACLGCNAPADCAGQDTECSKRTCTGGVCGTTNTTPGTALVDGQTEGDCSRKVCGPLGTIVDEADNGDVPKDDGDPCTAEVCALGLPGHPLQPVNTPCTSDGGKFCSALGACVQCTTATQCPAAATECGQATCSPTGSCGLSFTASGLPAPTQTDNDCKTNTCDGNGGITQTASLLDLPTNDGNPCTVEGCDANGTTSTPLAAGTVCDLASGNRCNAGSQCVAACSDGVQDPGETDADCGGLVCAKCANTKKCLLGTDCVSGNCAGFVCVPAAPKVVSIAPVAGAFIPTTGTAIAVTFDQEMDLASFSAVTAGGLCAAAGSFRAFVDPTGVTCVGFVSATLTLSADKKTVTGVLAGGLTAGTTLQIAITAAAKGESGVNATPFTSTPGFPVARQVTCTTGATDVVISQVYGGGSNSGATFKNDFVELHNRGNEAVSLAGWSLLYASETGNFGSGGTNRYEFAATASIPAGGYFLVGGAGSGANGVDLPTPDAVSLLAMAADKGKVALVRSLAPLVGGAAGNCPSTPDIADLVAYGGSTTCGEGTAASGNLSATLATYRKGYGCVDTQANSADFSNATPKPRNAATPIALCGCGDFIANETDRPFEADYCKVLTATVANTPLNGTLPSITGEIYDLGVTEAAGEPASVIGQIAIAPTGSAITSGGPWAFFAASWTNQGGNNDQYAGTPPAPSFAGTYDFLYRFSIDGRKSWTYCDKDGAGSNVALSLDDAQRGTFTTPLDVHRAT